MLDNIQIMGKLTLKEIRTLTGLSQKDFAEKVEIPFTSYRRYENNVAKMEVGLLFQVCDKLEISISNIKL